MFWVLIHGLQSLPPSPKRAGGEGQEKEAGRGGAGGDDIKICIDFAYF